MSVFADRGPIAAMLPDGRRLHLHHGPIDLIIMAEGASKEVSIAYGQAIKSFEHVLSDLVGELDLLRQRTRIGNLPKGRVAKRMWRATHPKVFNEFVTPMAAVAGAVADYILAAMCEGRTLNRAYVNNGGDIAVHLGSKEYFHVAVCTNTVNMVTSGEIIISAEDEIGGVATSGWSGRSHSLGIADAVTVLAENSASADAAATMIANAVNLKNPKKITRKPALEISSESDLGQREVTVGVAPLTKEEVAEAIGLGLELGNRLMSRTYIKAVFIYLQGMVGAASRLKNGIMKDFERTTFNASSRLTPII